MVDSATTPKDDPRPALDDDTAHAAPAPEPVVEPQREPDEPAPQLRGDPKRDAIAARYREKQAEEAAAEAAEGGEGDSGLDQPQAGFQPTPAQTPDDPDLELHVYGERKKFKRSELVARFQMEGFPDDAIVRVAQKELAADQRLAEAKGIADQLGRQAGAPTGAAPSSEGQPAHQPHDPGSPRQDELQPTDPSRSQHQGVDEEQLAEIAQRIQVGDSEEGVQALKDLVALARTEGVRAEEVPQLVQETIARAQHQSEIRDALTTFQAENPDIVKESDLFEVAQTMAARQMLDDMVNLGIPQSQLDELGNDKRRIAAAHYGLKVRGFNVRSLGEVLSAATTQMRTKFNIPRPNGGGPANPSRSPQPARPTAQQVQERTARKDLAQPQPRHGGARAGAPTGPRPLTASERVAQMRQQRGFR